MSHGYAQKRVGSGEVGRKDSVPSFFRTFPRRDLSKQVEWEAMRWIGWLLAPRLREPASIWSFNSAPPSSIHVWPDPGSGGAPA